MAEQPAPSGNPFLAHARKEPHGVKKMLYFFVLCFMLAIVFFSGVPVISKQSVQASLGELSARFTDYARESGGQAVLTYGDVSVVGAGYEKKALVKNVTLDIVRSPWLGANRVSISTPQAFFVPGTTGSGKYALEFPAPLILAFNGIPMYSVSFVGSPAGYFFTRQAASEGVAVVNTLALPSKLRVTPIAGGEAKAFTISYDADPQVNCRHVAASGKSQSTLVFKHITITGAKTIDIGAFAASLMRQPAPGGKLAFDSNIGIDAINVKGEHGAEGPYSLRLSAGGTRVAPASGALPPPDTDVVLREFSFTLDKFSLTAQGNLSRKADDSLPYGSAAVKVKDFSALRGNAALSPETKAMLVELAGRIGGVDASTADNFDFNITREKLGTLAIGHTTLADVTTTLLSQFMLGSAPAQPAPPAAAVTLQPPAAPAMPQAPASAKAAPKAPPASSPEKLAPASGALAD